MNFLKEYGSPKNLNCVWKGARLAHALRVIASVLRDALGTSVRVLSGVPFRLSSAGPCALEGHPSSPVDKAEAEMVSNVDRLH